MAAYEAVVLRFCALKFGKEFVAISGCRGVFGSSQVLARFIL